MHPSASWRGQLKQHGAIFGGVLIHQLMTHNSRQQDLQPGESGCAEEGAHKSNAGSDDCEVAGELGCSDEGAHGTSAGSESCFN